ncbi:MAG: hypothetical protein QMB65_11290, partial [Vicingaceae bacterium]
VQIIPSVCGGSSGSISNVNATGGVEPYLWSWFDGTTLIDSVQNITGIVSGTYNVMVTDTFGCTDSLGVFTVGNTSGVTIVGVINVDSASCGINNGSISNLSTIGGTQPFVYNWTFNGTPFSDSLNVDSLAAGSYTLTVTDFNLCSVQLCP